MAESIYPTDFFNIPHPTSPVVSVQFRTKVFENKPIDSPELWEEITFDPNNFFNDITIEDNSGYPSLSLTLIDKNYSYLEDKVVDMMTAQKLSNKLVENPDPSTDDTGYFEFFIDKKKSANIRVRIGYSEWGSDDYIADTDFEGEDYSSRTTDKKPVIRSPWIYFMITGLDMNITDNGLQVTIEGRDPTGSFLDKAKMVQKFAKLRGTPKNIINNIAKQVKKSSEMASEDGSANIEFEFEDDPQMYTNKDGGQEIEIMLGGKPIVREDEDGNRIVKAQYKKISQLLNEVCKKVSPVMYDKDGNKIPVSTDGSEEGKEVDNNSEKIKESYNYSFALIRKKDKDVINFFYKDPKKGLNQKYIRTYAWGMHGMSIVQNVDVSVAQLFGYLNMPVFTSGEDGSKGLYVTKTNKEKEGEVGPTLGSTTNASDAVNSEDFSYTFTSEVANTSLEETNSDNVNASMAAKRIMRRIGAELNEAIAKGSITLQGDPFFFFDGKIQPFTYLIKLIIKRPNYIDKNGEYIEGGKSYLSGLYRIKKITHSVSAGTYTTGLEVMKAPFEE